MRTLPLADRTSAGPTVSRSLNRPLRRIWRALDAFDRTAFVEVADSESPLLDAVLPRLSRAADHSVLWLAIAGLFVATGDRDAARAARRGIASVAVTSFVTNAVAKRVLPRRRPAIASVPIARRAARVPTSSSWPSGHSASAAAFAITVGAELPASAIPLAATAAGVAYSRVYTGVHYPGDVLAGLAIGAGVALVGRRVAPSSTPSSVPVPSSRRADQRPRPRGAGVVGVVNPRSGSGRGARVIDSVRAALPDADVSALADGADLGGALRAAAARAEVLAVGGGDGTVALAAQVASEAGLPLLVLPAGTFNHFAADLGLASTDDAAEALRRGTATSVDLGVVNGRVFVNTASIGGYPHFVAARERTEARLGKPLASALAVLATGRTAAPLAAVVDGTPRSLAMMLIGNGKYQPRGFVPSFRPRLDDGLLDVRLVEAGRWAARWRLALSLALGRLGHDPLYTEDQVVDLTITLPPGSYRLALDGEVTETGPEIRVEKRRRALVVFRNEGRRRRPAVRSVR